MTTDLVAWLRAQFDEDERDARAAMRLMPPGVTSLCIHLPPEVIQHNDRHGPGRVLAEVDAKRRILDLHEGDHECSTIRRGTTWDGEPYEEIDNCTWVLGGDCSTVRLLALPYADREGDGT